MYIKYLVVEGYAVEVQKTSLFRFLTGKHRCNIVSAPLPCS